MKIKAGKDIKFLINNTDYSIRAYQASWDIFDAVKPKSTLQTDGGSWVDIVLFSNDHFESLKYSIMPYWYHNIFTPFFLDVHNEINVKLDVLNG